MNTVTYSRPMVTRATAMMNELAECVDGATRTSIQVLVVALEIISTVKKGEVLKPSGAWSHYATEDAEVMDRICEAFRVKAWGRGMEGDLWEARAVLFRMRDAVKTGKPIFMNPTAS